MDKDDSKGYSIICGLVVITGILLFIAFISI